MQRTTIQEFYKGRSVFITGATGFCGKCLLEKLLRSCPGIGNIYLLMRPKKGLEPQERLVKLLEDPLFESAKQNLDESIERKVIPVYGDITYPRLGISQEDRELLCQKVSIVFHVAATVKFNENLKVALQTNVEGTQQVVELCKQIQDLAALVYVSTAFSQCPLNEIEEKTYLPPHDPQKLQESISLLSETELYHLQTKLLGKWPNTYTFSKALAEHIINGSRDVLPVAIFRPSIVLSTWKEPMPGWIDNIRGPTMGLIGLSLGMTRSIIVKEEMLADLIPVDAVVNALIAAAWETSCKRNADIMVYNFVSGPHKPILWGECFSFCREYAIKNPFSKAKWYCFGVRCRTKYSFLATSFVLEGIPACMMDLVPFVTSGKHRNVDLYRKSLEFLELVTVFSTQQWKFHDNNVRSLFSSLSPEDQKIFYFDLKELEWPEYLTHYMDGIKYYVLKEKPSVLPAARTRYQRLYIMHCLSQMTLGFLLFKIFQGGMRIVS